MSSRGKRGRAGNGGSGEGGESLSLSTSVPPEARGGARGTARGRGAGGAGGAPGSARDATTESSRHQPGETEQHIEKVDVNTTLNNITASVIAQYGYLEYSVFEREVGKQLKHSSQLVSFLFDIQRILKNIHLVINAALATNWLITLYDVHGMIFKLKDLEGLTCFEDLCIGSLLRFPLVETYFNPSKQTQERKQIPPITTHEVLRRISDMTTQPAANLSEEIDKVIDAFAVSKGYECGSDLCMYIDRKKLIHFFSKQARRAENRSRKEVEKHFEGRIKHLVVDLHLSGLQRGVVWWHRLRSLVADLDHAHALKCIKEVLQNEANFADLLEGGQDDPPRINAVPVFDGQELHSTLCNICSSIIQGTRWNCVTCVKVDLCDQCNSYRLTSNERYCSDGCAKHLLLPFCEVHGRRPLILYRLVWEILDEGADNVVCANTISTGRLSVLVMLKLHERELKLLEGSDHAEYMESVRSGCDKLKTQIDDPKVSLSKYLTDVWTARLAVATEFQYVVQDVHKEIMSVWRQTPRELSLQVKQEERKGFHNNLALLLYLAMYTTGSQTSPKQDYSAPPAKFEAPPMDKPGTYNAEAILKEFDALIGNVGIQDSDVLSVLIELDSIYQKYASSLTQPSMVGLIHENQLLCNYFKQCRQVKAQQVSEEDALMALKSQIESMQHLRVKNVWQVVDELQQLEHNTCKMSAVGQFAELTGGKSFLEFFAGSSQLEELIQEKLVLSASGDATTCWIKIEEGLLSRVKDVAFMLESLQKDTRTSSSMTSEFLRIHFNCHVGEELAAELKLHTTHCQDPMPFAFPRGWATLEHRRQDPVRASADDVVEIRREEVLAKIERTPPLQDMQEWIDWEEYSSLLGPFASFIQEQWKQKRVRGVIQISSDLFVRVERYGFIEFEEAVGQRRARDAAQAAVGEVFLSGSPYAQSIARLQKSLTEMLAREEDDGADASFILDAIACMPARLRKDVALPVFAEPFLSSVAHASLLLLASCKSQVHEIVLERLAVAFPHLNFNLACYDSKQTADAGTSSSVQAEEGGDASVQERGGDEEERVKMEERMYTSEGQNTESQTEVICRKIRKKYGIQLECREIDPELKKVLDEQRRMLKNSLKLLSTELYAKEIHYIHEIIQNCDDNSYAADQVPTLIIRLKEGLIEFENNELGFSEKDVESICSIGQSSKANRKGFIGHKGIGFKSVFKICSRPQIHSNHFHFELSAEATEGEENEGLEYIVPRPVAAPAGWRAGAGTKIVLSIPSRRRQEIQSCIQELDATILLFLRKLKVIEIQDARAEDGSIRIRRMIRESREEEERIRLVSLSEVIDGKGSSEDWLVLKTNVAEKVQDTCLQLAVPFMHELATEQGHKQRDVFAYLPVRCYGFRFIVNGDFIVTSSRESVDSMDSRNLCLRDGIAKHFPSLISELQDRYLSATTLHKEKQRDAHIEEYTQLVMSVLPTPGEVNDFFAVVPDQMRRSMEDLQLVPLRNGKFARARHAVWKPRKVERETIDLLEDLLAREGLGFVHEAVSKHKTLGEHLGIRRLRHVLGGILKHLEDMLQSRALDDQMLECLAWIFNELRGEEVAGSIEEASRRKLIPLASGVLVNPREDNVYAVQDVSDLLLEPSPRFRILHPLFAEKIGRYGGLTSFWKDMKVVWNNADAFLRNQLIPMLSDESTEQEDLVTGLTLVKKLLEKRKEQERRDLLLDLRRKGITLLDHEGKRVRSCDALHQGPSYSGHAEGTIELVGSVLGSSGAVPWKLVSSRYIEKDKDAVGWRGLFLGLGVLTFCHVQEPGYESEEMSTLYRCIMDSSAALDTKRSKLQHFFALLSAVWQEEYEQALGLPDDGDIAFLTFLRHEAKIPATDRNFHPPHLLLHKNEEVCRVLGAKGVYPDIDQLDKKLSQRLGIPSQLQASNVLGQLEHWRASSTPLSLSFMANVYKCLRSDEASIAYSSHQRFVFLPDKHAVMSLVTRQSKQKYDLDTAVETRGRWYSVSTLVQKDPSYLLDSDRADVTPRMNDLCCQGEFRSIEVYYRNLMDLFNGLGVRKEPPYEFYVNLLRQLDKEVATTEVLGCKLRVIVHFSFEFDDARDNLRVDHPSLRSSTLHELLALVRDTSPPNKWIESLLRLEEVVKQMNDLDLSFPSSNISSVALSRCLGIYNDGAVDRKLETLCDKVGVSLVELQSSSRWMNVVQQTVCLQLDDISDGKPDNRKIAVKRYPSHLDMFYHNILGLPYLADCIEGRVKAGEIVSAMKFTIPAAGNLRVQEVATLTFCSCESQGSESGAADGGAKGGETEVEISDPDLAVLCMIFERIKRFAVKSTFSVQVSCVRDLSIAIGITTRVDDFQELLIAKRRIASQRVGDDFVISLLEGAWSDMDDGVTVKELVTCLSEMLADENVTQNQIKEAVKESLSRNRTTSRRDSAVKDSGILGVLQGMRLEDEPKLEAVVNAGQNFSEVSKLMSQNRMVELEKKKQEAATSGSSTPMRAAVKTCPDPLAASLSRPLSDPTRLWDFTSPLRDSTRFTRSLHFMMPAEEEEEEGEGEGEDEAYELADIAAPADVESERLIETGRLGEEIMNDWLKSRGFDFHWMNQDAESLLPYDFVVRHEEREWFLEVKATESTLPESGEEDIYVSPREICFAMERPVALVRIYQTRSKSPRVLVYKAFSMQVRKNKIDCRARIRSRAIKQEVDEAATSL